MLKFSKSAESLVIKTTTGSLRIIRKDKETVFYQSLEGRELSPANQIRVELNRLLMNQNQRTNYQRRFSKMMTAIVEMAPKTLTGLAKKLGELPDIL